MKRIDENTYIDDTLVTCAEYQLFIDEMRKQGKYYQPDHWTSQKFPEGQAREPILGMRQLDAIAFCKWLTQRQERVWKFRLPNQKEANAFPMRPIGKSLLVYWIEENYQFAWAGSVPLNARAIDRSRVIDRSRAIAQDLNRALDLTYAHALDWDRALDCSGNRALDLDHDRAIVRAFDLTRDRALDLDLEHARMHVLSLDRALDLDLDYARKYLLNLDRDRAVVDALDLALDLDLSRTHVLERPFDLDRILDSPFDRALDLARALDLTLDIYIDLFTLQERIAERSPAFEGIRLVKERIR